MKHKPAQIIPIIKPVPTFGGGDPEFADGVPGMIEVSSET